LISNIAKANDIDIVAGTVVELGSHHIPHRTQEGIDKKGVKAHDDKLFNTAYYVDRTGKVIGRYTKKVSGDFCWFERQSIALLTSDLRFALPF